MWTSVNLRGTADTDGDISFLAKDERKKKEKKIRKHILILLKLSTSTVMVLRKLANVHVINI